MPNLTINKIEQGLRHLGLKKGDIVLVQSSLSKIGPINGIDLHDREGFASAIFKAFSSVIDIPKSGTLVVPTFTHEYARNKVPFIYEESPSEVGLFTEYLRKLTSSYRSLHPINSFCAIGRHKYKICKDLNISCYGYNSVLERLYKLKAKMAFLGCSLRHMTLQHHIEQIAGAPYIYMKAYFTPVYKNGISLKLPFLCCVRYLNGKVEPNDFSRFERHLRRKRMLRKGKIGNAKTLVVSVKDALNEGCRLLQKDPCYFLEKPFYMTR